VEDERTVGNLACRWQLAHWSEKPDLFLLTYFAEISFRIRGTDWLSFFFFLRKSFLSFKTTILDQNSFFYQGDTVTNALQRHKPPLIGAFLRLRKATISFVMFIFSSVCLSARNNSASTWRILLKFDIWYFYKICWENTNFIKIWQN